MDIQRVLGRVDEFQQRKRFLAFPFAVLKKFGDDRAGNLAALMAYYGFFSLFPLLLVMVSVLGLLLRGNPELQQRIVDSTLAQFPIIGDQLQRNVGALGGEGAGVTLGIGTITALWAGLGVMQASQNALNTVWDVPRKDRPNFLQTRLRSLIMLLVLGSVVIASTLLSGLGTATGSLGVLLRVVGLAGSLLINVGGYLVAYRVLTDRPLRWADVAVGAIFAGIVWTALHALGNFYIGHMLKNSSALYGFFAFVLGLLAWFYLGSQITLLGAEVNVVRKNRLWPRSLQQEPPLREEDRQTLRRAAKVEERLPQEKVDVTFQEGSDSDEPP
ncbi:MAG: YihY/virulence factor BrkB family protein [Actinomycetota bacterium]